MLLRREKHSATCCPGPGKQGRRQKRRGFWRKCPSMTGPEVESRLGHDFEARHIAQCTDRSENGHSRPPRRGKRTSGSETVDGSGTNHYPSTNPVARPSAGSGTRPGQDEDEPTGWPNAPKTREHRDARLPAKYGLRVPITRKAKAKRAGLLNGISPLDSCHEIRNRAAPY
jgi:hypothetical protein